MDNELSTLNYMRSKDTPGKTWWNCDAWHPAVGRALKIDRQEMGGVYALAPFRLWHDGERHLILAAYPAPRILGPVDPDWLDVEAVIAWCPLTDKSFVLGDETPQTVGRFPSTEQGTVFASPRDFLTNWAIERAAFFARWVQSRNGEWAHGATETDLIPGKLAIGEIDKIRWSGLPETIHCRGINPQNLNRAVLRQANLPRIVAQAERMAA